MHAWRVATLLGRGAWMQAGAALGYGVEIPAGITFAPGEAVEGKTNKYKMKIG